MQYHYNSLSRLQLSLLHNLLKHLQRSLGLYQSG